MKLGDTYRLSCGHKGKIVWINQDGETFAVKAPTGAGLCCNTKRQGGSWNPTVFLIRAWDETKVANHGDCGASHLTTLVRRFLRTLKNVKSWNQLDNLKGETELKHHVCNIMEYTFYFHKQQITEQEVEKLIHLLENGGR